MNKLPTIFENFDKLGTLFDHSVGFDDIFERMSRGFMESPLNPSFPPYNIKKVDDTHRTIELAVAGYTHNDIEVNVVDGVLKITAEKKDETEKSGDDYVFKGIASRSFTRQFRLSDHAEVEEASLRDGMLKVLVKLNEPIENEVKKIPLIT